MCTGVLRNECEYLRVKWQLPLCEVRTTKCGIANSLRLDWEQNLCIQFYWKFDKKWELWNLGNGQAG